MLTPNETLTLQEHTAELKRFNDFREKEVVLVSCTEAARLCGVKRPTISKWINEGKIHKTAIGESIGIKLDEVRRIALQVT